MKTGRKRPYSCRRILNTFMYYHNFRTQNITPQFLDVDCSQQLPSKEYTTKWKGRENTITMKKSDSYSLSLVIRFSINKAKLD